jgi:hypothetical protein
MKEDRKLTTELASAKEEIHPGEQRYQLWPKGTTKVGS